jgi:type I restriction enzyme R subunit
MQKQNEFCFWLIPKTLGEQAEQEFMSFVPNDDNRKFTELYSVQRLKSSYIATDSQVCISTIQRLYSILKGTELEESAEEENPNERNINQKKFHQLNTMEKCRLSFLISL